MLCTLHIIYTICDIYIYIVSDTYLKQNVLRKRTTGNMQGLLFSHPWVCRRWLLELLFFAPTPRGTRNTSMVVIAFPIPIYVCICIYVYIYQNEVSNRTLGPEFESQSVSTIKPPFRTSTDISARLSKSPGNFPSFAGVQSSNISTSKTNMLGYAAYDWYIRFFGTPM